MSSADHASQGEAAAAASPVLRTTELTKVFGATVALNRATVELLPAEIHCLVGENGSGKSTLVKIISGVQPGDDGTIHGRDGEQVSATRMTAAVAKRLGVHAVHQELPVFGPMSVAENLMLGRPVPTRLGRVFWSEVHRRATDVLARYEIPVSSREEAQGLSPALRAMVAIARALQDCDPDEKGLLVLDEPTAALSEHEVDVLLTAIRAYAAGGQSILLVTHRLEEVLGVAHRVTVLRDGRVITTRPREDLDRAELIRMIVGSDVATESTSAASPPGSRQDVVLSVKDLACGTIDGLSLDVRRGEIVGVTGILGSGVDDLVDTIGGLRRPDRGIVQIAGAPPVTSLQDVLAAGAVLVPQDRGRDGAFAPLSLRENLTLGRVGRFWRRGLLSRSAESADASGLIERFAIVPPDPRAVMSTLSGGNQQKVVIARALARDPALVVLHEPTQGVDIGARAQIHDHLRAAAAAGAAVLVATTDLDELLTLADRILVLAGGRIVATARPAELDRQKVISLMHHSALPRMQHPRSPVAA